VASSPASEVVTFEEFEANLRARELRRLGAKVKLPDQSFQVLVMLLEHPGELVTREEIRKRLWPGDTFVDFDHGLNNAVNRLREAIGDSADSPRFVETLPRRGYRFIATANGTGRAQVAFVSNSHSTEVTPELNAIAIPSKQRTESPKARGYRWFLWATPVVLSLALLIAFRPWTTTGQPSRRLFVLPPEGTTFRLIRDDGSAVALSPDGTKLAFSAVDAKGIAQIWVRPLGSLTAQALDGTEGATFPFWSPDGRSVAFFSDSDEKLKKVSLTGGAAVALCDAPHGRGGSWSYRGVMVFTPNVRTGLYQIPDSGGTPTPVTNVDASIHTTHRWPKFLPDGRHFIYLAASHLRDGSHNAVYLGSLDTTQTRLLVPSDADATYASGYLFFRFKNALMAQAFDSERGELRGEPRPTIEKVVYDPTIWKNVFDASGSGVMVYQLGSTVRGSQLQWFDRAGTKLGGVGEPGFSSAPRISPDGRNILTGRVASFGNYSDLWIYNLASGGEKRITSGDYDDSGGVWLHNGNRILFSGEGSHQIYAVNSSGVGPRELVLDAGRGISPSDITPDDRFLLCSRESDPPQKSSRLWVYPIIGGIPPFPLMDGEAGQDFGRFSPDGLWVAYASNDSGKFQVYIANFNAPTDPIVKRRSAIQRKLQKIQVSLSGGIRPVWRRDGRELFYIAADNAIMSVPVIIRGSSLEVGVARPLFRPIPGISRYPGYPYDVSLDGSKFIIALGTPPETTAPITLVENWLSDFKK
jgi:eukaryotic-like serine/threonine-protein kinase